MIKRIKPLKPDPVVTPQCEAPFDQTPFTPEYIKRRTERCDNNGWSLTQCGRPSTYEIEGKCLCTQHAGTLALKVLLRDN